MPLREGSKKLLTPFARVRILVVVLLLKNLMSPKNASVRDLIGIYLNQQYEGFITGL